MVIRKLARKKRLLIPALTLGALAACSADQPSSPATGGAGSSSVPSAGTAGLASSGGSSGGPAASAGNATGGTSAGSGGASSGTGGAQGGAGGSAVAGSSGNGGGGGGGAGGGKSSAGCDAANWPKSDRYTVQSSGMAREYVLDIPSGYDAKKPLRLVFGWHWRGGNANDVVNGAGNASRGAYYGLKALAEGSAIFVAPEGLVDDGVSGWKNPNGRDIQFTKDLLTKLNAELCIDTSRVFSTGFSYGGMMSIAVGCAMADTFRAVAPMAGAAFSGCEEGNASVAFFGTHAPGDGVVGIDQGRSARDTFVQRNGCGSETMPSEPSGCVAYQGCKAGFPVTWCEFTGDHYTPEFAPTALWRFFSQF